MVELQKFLNQEEAQTALSYLHANGIDAELEGANTFSTMPHVGMGATMLRLVVPEAQLNSARNLLSDVHGGRAATFEDFPEDYDFGEPEDGPMEGTGFFIEYRIPILIVLGLFFIFFFIL